MRLDSRYADYFTEYPNYFGRALRLLKYIYGTTKSGRLLYDELTECLLEACFIQYQFHMSIYYKYTPDWEKIVVLSYVSYCVYWYTYEFIGKLFVDRIEKRFYVNFL